MTTNLSKRVAAGVRGLSTCALLLSACAGTALGVGPDVIVGDLPDVSNYTSGGAVSGKRAYSVGTTSCNIGTVELQWVRNTNQHPVISGNMYRIMNGRFEQIGQSWLKHGFTALQGTVCDSCSGRWPNGNALGVGCSDPYSSGLNGSQSGLGPKSEVNASTGNFAYPWVNAGDSSTALGKRLVVADADVGISGARYFVASMYVTPDDATSGNSNNNQSYRPINVNATTKDISLTGTTARMKPAIFAWREHGLGAGLVDPDVAINTVDIPNDGRMIVAVKVSPLGGGVYHYEYAVQNLNSHQSGQSFSIPVPAAAVVTNIGFHDVDYHSGEPFVGTDWSSTVSGGAVTWSTQTMAQNVNANALRFDTIYNFRFDCNLPPSGGLANIGLFRPGTVNAVNAATQVPSVDGQYHPANDSCANALDVGAGSIPFSTVDAATNGPAEPGSCNAGGTGQYDKDLWYRYTSGTCTDPTVISTCGSNFDTKIAVYASCPSGPGSVLFCNDDFNCSGGTGTQSQLSFNPTANTTYLIRVGGYNGASGTGTLTITPSSCLPPGPVNETCASAIVLAENVIISGTTTNSVNNGTASCGAAATSPDVWYRYHPSVAGNVTISTCDSVNPTFDTVLAVFTGTCGGLTQVACNDDSCGLRSSITYNNTVADRDLFIRVAGYNGATGDFKIKVTGGAGVVPPANDNCANRPGIPLGNTPFTTVGATTDGPTHNGCNFFGNNNITNDVWFNYPSDCEGTLVVSVCGNANFDTKLAVYSGYGCENYESRLLACSDDDCGNQSTVSVPAHGNTFYTIRLGGYNGAMGTGTLNLTCVPFCPADFNQDGGVDGADVDAFFTAWQNGLESADVNQDGGVDGSDVATFFTYWSAGSC